MSCLVCGQQHFDVLKKQGGIWVLVSKKSNRVLKKFGKNKPSEQEVAAEERRISFFKHKKDASDRPKIPNLSAPLSIERDYQKQIRQTVANAADLVRQIIIPALPQLVADNKSLRGDSQNYDEPIRPVGDVIAELYESTRIQLGEQLNPRDLERLAQNISVDTADWNKQQVHRVFRQVLGVDLLQGEPWLAEMLNVFAINNANLITNVSNTFIDQTQQIVNEGMIKGWRHEQIATKILGTGEDELNRKSKFRLAKTRANLIARDQINKLNGQLNHLRQINAGITHYFWRDSDDARVRPQHAFWDGQRFSWARGATGGIHPGDEIQCRCWPEPDFSTFKF